MLNRLIFRDYCSDNSIISQDRLHAALHSKGSISNELARIFRLWTLGSIPSYSHLVNGQDCAR
jgi:hypothetical protein